MISFLWAAFVIQQVLAASTPVATSAIITVYTTTTFIYSSKIIGSSSTVYGGTPTCRATTLNGVPTTVCLSAIALSMVPIYGPVSVPVVTTITSTIGYSTIYSNIPLSSASSIPSVGTSASIFQPATSVQQSQTTISIASVTQSSSLADIVTTFSISTEQATESVTSKTSSPTAFSSADTNRPSLSTGFKAAIALAAILGATITLVIAYFVIRSRRSKRKEHQTPEYDHMGVTFGKAELAEGPKYTATSENRVTKDKAHEVPCLPAELANGSGVANPNSTHGITYSNGSRNVQQAVYEMEGTSKYGMGTRARP